MENDLITVTICDKTVRMFSFVYNAMINCKGEKRNGKTTNKQSDNRTSEE